MAQSAFGRVLALESCVLAGYENARERNAHVPVLFELREHQDLVPPPTAESLVLGIMKMVISTELPIALWLRLVCRHRRLRSRPTWSAFCLAVVLLTGSPTVGETVALNGVAQGGTVTQDEPFSIVVEFNNTTDRVVENVRISPVPGSLGDTGVLANVQPHRTRVVDLVLRFPEPGRHQIAVRATWEEVPSESMESGERTSIQCGKAAVIAVAEVIPKQRSLPSVASMPEVGWLLAVGLLCVCAAMLWWLAVQRRRLGVSGVAEGREGLLATAISLIILGFVLAIGMLQKSDAVVIAVLILAGLVADVGLNNSRVLRTLRRSFKKLGPIEFRERFRRELEARVVDEYQDFQEYPTIAAYTEKAGEWIGTIARLKRMQLIGKRYAEGGLRQEDLDRLVREVDRDLEFPVPSGDPAIERAAAYHRIFEFFKSKVSGKYPTSYEELEDLVDGISACAGVKGVPDADVLLGFLCAAAGAPILGLSHLYRAHHCVSAQDEDGRENAALVNRSLAAFLSNYEKNYDVAVQYAIAAIDLVVELQDDLKRVQGQIGVVADQSEAHAARQVLGELKDIEETLEFALAAARNNAAFNVAMSEFALRDREPQAREWARQAHSVLGVGSTKDTLGFVMMRYGVANGVMADVRAALELFEDVALNGESDRTRSNASKHFRMAREALAREED